MQETTNNIELTIIESNILAHSIGIDILEHTLSFKPSIKKWPKTFYRNYYNALPNTTKRKYIDDLVSKKLMTKISTDYYAVTELGIKLVKEVYDKTVIHKKYKDIDIEYMKHLINTYCLYVNINFCPDNSEHIFEYYIKYYLKKHKVSHTTKLVIERFKNHLRKIKPQLELKYNQS